MLAVLGSVALSGAWRAQDGLRFTPVEACVGVLVNALKAARPANARSAPSGSAEVSGLLELRFTRVFIRSHRKPSQTQAQCGRWNAPPEVLSFRRIPIHVAMADTRAFEQRPPSASRTPSAHTATAGVRRRSSGTDQRRRAVLRRGAVDSRRAPAVPAAGEAAALAVPAAPWCESGSLRLQVAALRAVGIGVGAPSSTAWQVSAWSAFAQESRIEDSAYLDCMCALPIHVYQNKTEQVHAANTGVPNKVLIASRNSQHKILCVFL